MRKIFLLLTTLFVLTSPTDAAKVDMYRDALLNKSFTLKYEIVEVPIVETSRDAIYSLGGLHTKEDKNIFDYLHKGIVVMSGDNIYTETAHDDYVAKSRYFSHTASINFKAGGYGGLVKDGETFSFAWDEDNGKRHYHHFKNATEQMKKIKEFKTPYQKLLDDYDSYLVTLADGAFAAILPPEKIIATPQTHAYKFFASGTLDNGLTYEDFVSDKGDTFSAVRYYFDGDKMIKIAMASYVRGGGKILSYSKSVINITEFSTTPDQNYLQLPAELKDKTKR